MNAPRTPAEARRAGWRQVTTPPSDSPAVEALARVLDPEAFDPRVWVKGFGWNLTWRQITARDHAERALAAGYRLVSEEPG